MLYTIADLNDVFYQEHNRIQCRRSSNPYDYIRTGYYLDNAALFGGTNNVSYNCNFPSNSSGNRLDISNQ